MTARVAITHRIDWRFDRPVRLSTHWLRLRPAPQTRARIAAYSLELDAGPHFLNWVRDPFENHLARLDLPEPLAALGIGLELIAELEPVNPLDFLSEPEAARHPFGYPAQLHKELAPYLQTTEPGPRLRAWLAELDRTPSGTTERLSALNLRVHAARALAAGGGDPGQIDPEALLARDKGSCWELAWLLTLSLRHLGLAARFVCGYRIALAADDSAAQDGVSLHAWSEVFIPGAGWIGLDPSAGLFTTELYIPLACAPDPLRVRPIVGDLEGCVETRTETLGLRRLTPQAPRWPYTDTQWADIQTLGMHVERDLAARGFRPTLGASISLVASDPGAAPEWNTAALGPAKRAAAEQLLAGLRRRLGHSGVPQLGQGTWYAGDALPRWRLGCFFRADDQPVWRNREWLGFGRPRTAFAPGAAAAFARALARALGVAEDHAIAAHEDPLHELWRARGVPGPRPLAEDLDDPTRRRALAERLSAPSAEPAGYVLPIRWDHVTERWTSGAWQFRRSQLFLVPGDSPLGYRLPLDSLVHDEHSALEAQLERCPFEERHLLPEFHGEVSARLSTLGAASPGLESADAGPSARRTPHTALCAQIRDGQLHVFLPPVTHLEHYLELIAAVEAAAEATRTPVILEGYHPPEDPRLRRLVLEPDAGVLRVILPESQSWQERIGILQAVYQAAAAAGLRADRVTPDGASLPSGGGGSLTLGGAPPADSPFLRRPELLRALIAYWQRHPSLSYFFAGRLIGPGGPAPRADEGRAEALYELSIALERLPRGESAALWQADRVLRHLLADPSGDLKRAELGVDQLYAPERAGLRQGRIFIHAFETAPDARIAALQSLLVLGLLGRFARESDSGELVRWGPALHDRFMLPYVLWGDLCDVVEDLNAAGYPFQLEWFESLKALRFPVLGQVLIGAITLELQTAHEPWPLLSEEVTAQGVTRFIDVANERMQVRLATLAPGRYVLSCNGQQVPLREGDVHGEYVAGVRYKTSNPPATRHPTIPPAGALVFDLIDTWTGRAIGGCTYLPPQPQLWGPVGSPMSVPAAPGIGDEFAEQRVAASPWLSLAPIARRGRFIPQGSGIGPMAAPAPAHTDEHPFLLDLTR